MKKLKKVWQENNVLFVLLTILIACLIAISIVVVTYFIGDSSSKYGGRLEGIDKISFSDKEIKEITSKLLEDELIEEVSINISGKIIYISINFKSGTILVEAQSKAITSLDLFSEDVLGFFDLEYLIKSDATAESEGFQIMGSHNVSGTGSIVWNNNTKVSSEEE